MQCHSSDQIEELIKPLVMCLYFKPEVCVKSGLGVCFAIKKSKHVYDF